MRLRSRDVVSRYYDGWLRSDDELAPIRTRNVCLRVQASGSHLSLNDENFNT